MTPADQDRIYIHADHGTAFVSAGDPLPQWAADIDDQLDRADRPAPSASKADWLEWASSVDLEVTDTMTKADIIAAAAELPQ